MLSSRDISLLRPDVAANCRALLERAEAEGLPVLVTGTVRDAEYQQQCFERGTAKTKVPSFHGEKAGLAFDFCKNVKGHEYDDTAFFERVGALGKEIGFSWGGDWKDFPDRPHFQWDAKGKYTAAMVRAGDYPPAMPLWKEEREMTQEQFDEMLADYLARLSKKLPSPWSEEARRWAEAEGLIAGNETGEMSYQSYVTREQMAVFLKRMAEWNEKRPN